MTTHDLPHHHRPQWFSQWFSEWFSKRVRGHAKRVVSWFPLPTGGNHSRSPAVLVPDSGFPTPTKPPTCKTCGCTDNQACWPTCWWIEPDLCSSCNPMDGA